MNNGIDKKLCSFSCISIDAAVNCILALGKGSVMAKMDIKHPSPSERSTLLGVKWMGELFINKALPFGLRSTPSIFTALADALRMGLRWRITTKIILSQLALLVLAIAIRTSISFACVYRITGIPVQESNTEGPSSVTKFLGMELDSVAIEIRLTRRGENAAYSR